MISSIFSFHSYKAVMSDRLGGAGNRGQISRAADALGCQRSYLSRVISGDLQLTPDHAYQLTSFWNFTADEREYFLTLVEHERAANPEYRIHIKSKLSAIKAKSASIQERTQRKHLSIDGLQAHYFSSWIWTALHFLACIPRYQTIEALAQRIGIPQSLVLQTLEQMQSMGLVAEHKGKWIYQSGEFHVAKDSPLVILHHQNWRHKAVVDAQNLLNENVHFTGILTLSQKDLERVKELLLEFISRASAIASPSKPEEAVALTCDFFAI